MKTIFTFIFILSVHACKDSGSSGRPECLDSRLAEFKLNACSGGSVKQYTFQGADVYVFDPGTCGADMTSEVINESCNTLGYLGGITGNNRIAGEDFSKAVYIRTVWTK